MLSNIEPLAREMTVNICRRAGMAEADIAAWIDLHWTCAAAMLEAGVMDEAGEKGPRKGWGSGLAPYPGEVGIYKPLTFNRVVAAFLDSNFGKPGGRGG